MDISFVFFGYALIYFGILGCFINKMPGAPLAFLGLVALRFGANYHAITTTVLVLCVASIIAAQIVEHSMPKRVGRIHKFSNGGRWGCKIGAALGIGLALWQGNASFLWSLLALCILPLGCAILGEFIGNKYRQEALKAGATAWLDYFCRVLLQVSICFYALNLVQGA